LGGSHIRNEVQAQPCTVGVGWCTGAFRKRGGPLVGRFCDITWMGKHQLLNSSQSTKRIQSDVANFPITWVLKFSLNTSSLLCFSGNIYSLMWDPPNAINHPQNRHFYGWYKPSPNRCTMVYGIGLPTFFQTFRWSAIELLNSAIFLQLSPSVISEKVLQWRGANFGSFIESWPNATRTGVFFWSGCSRNNWVFVPSPKFHGKNMGV
jgi:hypothetical protein